MSDAVVPLAARLNYAQCWEDTRVLVDALAVSEGDRVLSIASAGDNSIALALTGAEVVAIDLSLPQLATVELKLAGAHVSHRQYLALLGVEQGSNPLTVYRRIADRLSPPAREWWDAHPEILRGGVLAAGRFEQYLSMFRTRVLPFVHRASTTRRWFDMGDLGAQRDFYDSKWDNWRWQGLFRLFFSQRVMAARGRSPEQFAHVDGPISRALLMRAERLLKDLPLRDNGYLQWMLTGGWVHPDAMPLYLTKKGHARLREASQRISLVHASLDDYAARPDIGTFSAYNLSDVFEYMSEQQTEALYTALLGVARPGARFAYWNLFVDRERPQSLADRVHPDYAKAEALFALDRFIYGAFRLETAS